MMPKLFGEYDARRKEVSLLTEIRHLRPVSRELVHRASSSEVFVAELLHSSDMSFETTAQLPSAHQYYNDHLGADRKFDIVGAVEAIRQSAILFAHQQHQISLDTAFIFTNANVETVPTDGSEYVQESTRGPVEAIITGTISEWKIRDGERVGFTVKIVFSGIGAPTVATVIGCQWMPKSAWSSIRARQRSALDLGAQSPHPLGLRVAPWRLARSSQNNVVVGAPTAQRPNTFPVLVDQSYAGMFDHELDHVPAAVMFEAARQASLLTAESEFGLSPLDLSMTKISVDFVNVAELELPVDVNVAIVDADTNGIEFIIELRQLDRMLATGSTRISRRSTRRGSTSPMANNGMPL